LLSRSNPNAAKILRVKEAFLDTSFINDPIAASRLMAITLAQRSKARRSIPEFRVTNPIGTLFRPFMPVSFNDGLSDTSQELLVQRVRYVISAVPGEPMIGTYHCDLSLGGSFNTLLGSCSCL